MILLLIYLDGNRTEPGKSVCLHDFRPENRAPAEPESYHLVSVPTVKSTVSELEIDLKSEKVAQMVSRVISVDKPLHPEVVDYKISQDGTSIKV